MQSKRIAVLAVQTPSGELGGAERFYQGLKGALNAEGVKAELLSIVSDESSFDAIQESYLRFYDLDLAAYDGVISTKAPAYAVRHPNHVTYLQHTMRVFYDMYEYEYRYQSPELKQQRRLIHALDTAALGYPRTKRVFVIGEEVRKRLEAYNGLKSEVLYQGLSFDKFHSGSYGDYVLLPGRLHRWKRVDLAIDAMLKVNRSLVLKIVGSGEDEARFRAAAGNDQRIEFLGRVSDSQLVELYAGALAVIFVPIREDFGLVTLEAFRSSKPVITCKDSGEPANIVEDGVTGFVCNPESKELASRIEYLHDHLNVAEKMGVSGSDSIKHIGWNEVAQRLLKALRIF